MFGPCAGCDDVKANTRTGSQPSHHVNIGMPADVVWLRGIVADEAGRGIAGVPVSNGELIVPTDSSGSYEIEGRPGIHRFLTISVPDGYGCTEWFCRLGKRRERVDFEMHSDAEDRGRFTAAHITDLHVVTNADAGSDGPTAAGVAAADISDVIAEMSPAFVLATGDLTDLGTQSQLEAFRSMAKDADAPIYPGFGSHDANQMMHSVPGRERTEPDAAIRDWLDDSNAGITHTGPFEAVVGPTHYSFDFGSWHFVLFPNESYSFSAYDQLRLERWLHADLAMQPPGRPIAVATHQPPRASWLDQLSRYDVRMIVHGHTHASKVFRYRDITVASTPPMGLRTSDANPRGYRALRFDGERLHMELCPLRAADPPQPPAASGCDRTGLHLMWERRLPAHVHRAAPVANGGSLLISLQDEDDGTESGVCRVSREDGAIEWHMRADSAVRNRVVLTENGHIVAVSSCGRVLCLDGATGSETWSVDTPGFPERWLAGTAAVSGGLVYVGAKSGYAAYDAGTGEERWYTRFSGTLDLIADPVGDKWAAHFTPIVHRDLLICLVPRRALVALNRHTGRIVWELALSPQTQDWWASPILVGETVVSGGDPGQLVTVRADDGTLLWSESIVDERLCGCDYPTGLVSANNAVYAGTCDGQLVCCELATGRVRWRFQTGPGLLDMAPRRGGSSVLAEPVLFGGRVVACGIDGVLNLLDAETGERVCATQFEAPITAAPVVLGGDLFVATWDGRLRRFTQRG